MASERIVRSCPRPFAQTACLWGLPSKRANATEPERTPNLAILATDQASNFESLSNAFGSLSIATQSSVLDTRSVAEADTENRNDRRLLPLVRLSRMQSSARQFEIAVVGKKSFWHRMVVIERFDRRLGRWMNVRSVVLTQQDTVGT
jgi:hypothetical protein